MLLLGVPVRAMRSVQSPYLSSETISISPCRHLAFLPSTLHLHQSPDLSTSENRATHGLAVQNKLWYNNAEGRKLSLHAIELAGKGALLREPRPQRGS